MPKLSFDSVRASDGNFYKLDLIYEQIPAPLNPNLPPEIKPEPTTPQPGPTKSVETKPQPVLDIPLSRSDLRFKNNKPGTTGAIKRGTLTNVTWDHSPGYRTGEPCFIWEGDGSDVLTIDKALIDCREGPRIGAGSNHRATLNINDSFINCVGKGEDHADGVQAYSPGGVALIDVRRTCFRSYSDNEARTKYGSGFIGSCGFFWADEMEGELRFEDVVIWGGGRGVAIYADKGGDTRVSWENVFFVPGPDGWTYWPLDVRGAGGKLTIDKWVNVRHAKIENGKIVPGKEIPRPA